MEPGTESEWRCLTVRQWWCWAMAYGGKHVENRARGVLPWKYRGWVAFHAAKDVDAHLRGRMASSHEGRPRWAYLETPAGADECGSEVALAHAILDARPSALEALFVRSAIIGRGRLVDIHLAADGCCEPWGEAWYRWSNKTTGPPAHLVFEDVAPIWPPIDCSGHLGLWRPSPDLAAELDRCVG